MFPTWRLQLREARIAVDDGRWEEAARQLASEPLCEFWPAKKLSRKLADQLVTRARQRLAGGESSAGWRDVSQAEMLGASATDLAELRDAQISERLDQVAALVAAGETNAANDILIRMERRGLRDRRQAEWRNVVRGIEQSRRLARRGDFVAARDALAQANRRVPAEAVNVLARLGDVDRELQDRSGAVRKMSDDLYQAVAESNWTSALSVAAQMLELAPEHVEARRARRRAWRAIGMERTEIHRGPATPPVDLQSPAPRRLAASTHRPPAQVESDTVTSSHKAGRRWIAWIDRVGGFLICLDNEIVLGRPDPAGGVDVAFQADLSRRHAVIRREGESYVLTPAGPVEIDGTPVRTPTVLRDGAALRLGDALRLKFRRPHALSATAVLEIESHHKTKPAADGIVLMSESCILGSEPHCHIPCRGWTSDLALFRQGDELRLRGNKPLTVDGQPGIEQTAVAEHGRIEGDDFALSFEEI